MTAYDYTANNHGTNGGSSPEHRQRCCNNNNNGSSSCSTSSVEVPSAVAAATAAAAAAIRSSNMTTKAATDNNNNADVDAEDDLDYADQKYDKRAKARLLQKRRRRNSKQAASSLYGYGFFSSSSTGKPPSVAQMAGLLLLFTALLSMWHYMRTVWWTHGRLAAARRHVLESQSHMNIYQLAEARIKEHHMAMQQQQQHGAAAAVGGVKFFDAAEAPYRARHEQQERKRWQRQQQEQHRLQQQQQQQQQNHQHHQQQQHRDDGSASAAHRGEDESNSNSRRRGGGGDDEPPPPPQEGGHGNHQQQQKEEEEDEMDMEQLETLSTNRLQELFLQQRRSISSSSLLNVEKILVAWLSKLNHDVLSNVHGGIRWIRPYLLPPLPGLSKPDDDEQRDKAQRRRGDRGGRNGRFRFGGGGGGSGDSPLQKQFFRVDRMGKTTSTTRTLDGSSSSSQFTWEDEWNDLIQQHPQQQAKKDDAADIDLEKNVAHGVAKIARKLASPEVDYTSKDKYQYPTLQGVELPEEVGGSGKYPHLTTLASMMEHWDQDADFHGTITETLLHFNYSDPDELEMARKFRDAELPFKLTNVPELDAANLKWTDEYVSKQFDRPVPPRGYLKQYFHSKTENEKNDPDLQPKPASGLAQESPNHYFAFFTPPQWHVDTMGLPPVRNNDWTFAKWSEHAKYADAVRLSPDQPHFYWQSGVDKEERHGPKADWTFISRDLPSWSSPTETFMVFNPQQQKGIQCRFGERGVVAATHYDSGRNMVGMITGAKRYILSPPKACSKLGIFTHQKSPIFRHSLLNFGHLKYLDNNHDETTTSENNEEKNPMSKEERAWLERASQAEAVETVLKAGEVLYIPSFWFHYIISLQKSAQCNVRSGVGHEGSGDFGGHEDVVQCVD